MTAIAMLAAAFAGFALIGLSMERHARQADRPVSPERARPAGWALIALSFAIAIGAPNWRFGVVQWVGMLGAGAALVLLTLYWKPSRLYALAIAALPLGVAALLASAR